MGVAGKVRTEYDKRIVAANLELVQAVEKHYRTVVRNAKKIAG
jgi:hypothetical protein